MLKLVPNLESISAPPDNLMNIPPLLRRMSTFPFWDVPQCTSNIKLNCWLVEFLIDLYIIYIGERELNNEYEGILAWRVCEVWVGSVIISFIKLHVLSTKTYFIGRREHKTEYLTQTGQDHSCKITWRHVL